MSHRTIANFIRLCAVAALVALGSSPYLALRAQRAPPAGGIRASADLKDAKAQTVGHAEFLDTQHGVLIRVTLKNAPAGIHGLHVHNVARCDPPTFDTAGPHFNPAESQHGFLNPKGAHAGDLPNVHASRDGQLEVEHLAPWATLRPGPTSLFDADGSALVLHAGPDDYRTDPTGNAGTRLACGVVIK